MRGLVAVRGAVLIALLAAGGCVPYAVVEASRIKIGATWSVEPQARWTSLRQAGRGELWTIDGPALEAVRFLPDVGDGETLFKHAIGPGARETPEDKQPRFRVDMTPSEVMELVVDTWRLLGLGQIRATDLRPARFAGADGFRFDLAFVWPDGVEGRAMVAGATIESRLQLIVYSGTRLHYFARYRPVFERLLASIRLE